MAARQPSGKRLDFHIVKYVLSKPPVTCWAFAITPEASRTPARVIYYIGGGEICYETVPEQEVEFVAKIGTVPLGGEVAETICESALAPELATENNLSWFVAALHSLQLRQNIDHAVCEYWSFHARLPRKPVRVCSRRLSEKAVREAGLSKTDLVISRLMLETCADRGLDIAGVSVVGLPPGNSIKKVDEGMIEPDLYLQWRRVTHIDGDRRWQPVFTTRALVSPVFHAIAQESFDETRTPWAWPALQQIDENGLGLLSEPDDERLPHRKLEFHQHAFTQAWNPITAQTCCSFNALDPWQSKWRAMCDLSDSGTSGGVSGGAGIDQSGSAAVRASSSSWIARTAPSSVRAACSQQEDPLALSATGDQGIRSRSHRLASRDQSPATKISVRDRRSTYRAKRGEIAARGRPCDNQAFHQVLDRFSVMSVKDRGGSSSGESFEPVRRQRSERATRSRSRSRSGTSQEAKKA